ncbi:MAG: tyrosine-type recombinase/integrase, partial [Gammaproteobacteria bacterium]|nr:tyrosine-type recombinase/integrase [Gammaproteobacteria bacterium]
EWQDLMIEFYPKVDTSRERLVVRNFLVANHVPVTKGEISGRKHASAGTLSRLFVERPILDQIFDYLKKTDFQAYVVDKFMFKTGTRISATLAARLERIRVVDGVYDIQSFDKGVRSIHPEGKEWIKHISRDLLEDIKALTDYPDNKSGPIFTYEDQEMSDKNREALEKFYPQLWEQYPDYDDHNHFWRHMFAQHLLRKTGWNYGVVAALGGWDIKSLEESYGRPPVELMRKWGVELIADL